MIYLDCLLVLGVLLSAASQLRVSGLPVGPGEALLGVWVSCMLVREVRRGGPALTRHFLAMAAFWTVFWLMQSVGLLNAFVLGEEHDTGLLVHDVVAFVLVSLMSCLLAADRDAGVRLGHIAWLASGLGAMLLAAQVAMAVVPISESIDVWYWTRFRGWSENPNQLGLLCSALLLIGLYVLELARGARQRGAALLGIGITLVAGLLTLSNSFRIVLATGVAIVAAVRMNRWLALRSTRPNGYGAAAWLGAAAVPLLGLYLVAVAGTEFRLGAIATGLSRSSEATEGEAALRVQLWTKAWERSLETGMIGLGPGPHVPPPPSFVAYMKRMGSSGPEREGSMPRIGTAANFESHNTFLELLLQGGVILVTAYLTLIITLIATNLRSGRASLVALAASLAIYGTFHVILRNPIVWLGFALALDALAQRTRAPRPRLSRSRAASWKSGTLVAAR